MCGGELRAACSQRTSSSRKLPSGPSVVVGADGLEQRDLTVHCAAQCLLGYSNVKQNKMHSRVKRIKCVPCEGSGVDRHLGVVFCNFYVF